VTRVAAIVLAAGRSSRYRAAGGLEETKLVANLDGAPIIRRVAQTALDSRARPVIVVVGHARNAVERALHGLPLTVAFNPDYAAGLSTSLRAGLESLQDDVEGAVVLLGDMPMVNMRHIDALIEAFEAKPAAHAVAPLDRGRRGNPVLLARALFEPALHLSGDEGARRLLDRLGGGEVVEVATTGGDTAHDIDRPSDLSATQEARGCASPAPD
jgi:molybdenum cofactor cytidylyltransferase